MKTNDPKYGEIDSIKTDSKYTYVTLKDGREGHARTFDEALKMAINTRDMINPNGHKYPVSDITTDESTIHEVPEGYWITVEEWKAIPGLTPEEKEELAAIEARIWDMMEENIKRRRLTIERGDCLQKFDVGEPLFHMAGASFELGGIV